MLCTTLKVYVKKNIQNTIESGECQVYFTSFKLNVELHYQIDIEIYFCDNTTQVKSIILYQTSK